MSNQVINIFLYLKKTTKKLVSKETVVLHQCERETRKFGLSNELIRLELPP